MDTSTAITENLTYITFDGNCFLVHRPGSIAPFPYQNINEAYNHALIRDFGLVVKAILNSSWTDSQIDLLIMSSNPKHIEDYERKAYPVIEAVYVLLCKNCIDKHHPNWKRLSDIVTEFLTKYKNS